MRPVIGSKSWIENVHGIEVAVPADDVERVVVDDVRLVAAADAHLDRELAALADRVQLGRRMDVAVVVRRALDDLPVLVAVAARDLDQPGRLEDEVALRPFRPEAVRRAARDDDVVAVLVRQVAEDRLQRARALVDEDRPRRPRRCGRSSPSTRTGGRARSRRRRSTSAARRPVISSPSGSTSNVLKCRCACASGTHSSRSIGSNAAELHDAARRLEVVEDRLVAGEALEAHDLLGQERAVVAELDVPLARNVAEALVEGHRRQRIA